MVLGAFVVVWQNFEVTWFPCNGKCALVDSFEDLFFYCLSWYPMVTSTNGFQLGRRALPYYLRGQPEPCYLQRMDMALAIHAPTSCQQLGRTSSLGFDQSPGALILPSD